MNFKTFEERVRNFIITHPELKIYRPSELYYEYECESSWSNPDQKGELHFLYLLLELNPLITLQQYTDLFLNVSKLSIWRDNGYYGDWSSSVTFTYNLKKLYDYLIINKLIEDEKD
jgi:hypothetical protein